jgi:hypothetical protein
VSLLRSLFEKEELNLGKESVMLKLSLFKRDNNLVKCFILIFQKYVLLVHNISAVVAGVKAN